ncbi:MAG: DUF1080 domain-containing protein [Gemmataceae bacterium]
MFATCRAVGIQPFKLAVFACFLCGPFLPHASADDFTAIFNGVDFTGWHAHARASAENPKPDPWKTWKVEQGIITCTGKPNGVLATEKEYENYTLRLKWRFLPDALTKVKRPNSGVLLHVNGPDKVWPLSIEMQMANGEAGDLWLQEDVNKKFPTLDVDPKRHDPKQARRFIRIGGTEKRFDKPLGEWNSAEITCRGGAISVVINGLLANETKDGSLKKGRIGFQAEGIDVQFKEIEIKQLKP